AHNRFVDRLREDGVAEPDLFTEARRAMTWHYQWIALFDFLPMTIGEHRVRRLLDEGPRFFRPRAVVSIPFEFADAAYRYGRRHRVAVGRGNRKVRRRGAAPSRGHRARAIRLVGRDSALVLPAQGGGDS